MGFYCGGFPILRPPRGHLGLATCARPYVKKGHLGLATCAGPHVKRGHLGLATCAGPYVKRGHLGLATCAGPYVKRGHLGLATCVGPYVKKGQPVRRTRVCSASGGVGSLKCTEDVGGICVGIDVHTSKASRGRNSSKGATKKGSGKKLPSLFWFLLGLLRCCMHAP